MTSSSVGVANGSNTTDGTKGLRSLFISDYNISHTISWNELAGLSKEGSGTIPTENLMFGKKYDTNYKLRSLSGGSSKIELPLGGSPTTNEWDSILNKNNTYIKNYGIYSWGQDTNTLVAIANFILNFVTNKH